VQIFDQQLFFEERKAAKLFSFSWQCCFFFDHRSLHWTKKENNNKN
jgi:hypothetical protein